MLRIGRHRFTTACDNRWPIAVCFAFTSKPERGMTGARAIREPRSFGHAEAQWCQRSLRVASESARIIPMMSGVFRRSRPTAGEQNAEPRHEPPHSRGLITDPQGSRTLRLPYSGLPDTKRRSRMRCLLLLALVGCKA